MPQMINVIKKVSNRDIAIRAAHITDMHFLSGRAIDTRLPLFKQSLFSKSLDLVINSGDTIDNSIQGTHLDDFHADIDTYGKPYIVARGNHDYGANNQQLRITDNYYYYDQENWRFIVLYSQGGGNYALGATQLQWLTDLLDTTPSDKFICIISHVPILGVAGLMWYLRYSGSYSFPTDVHSDANQLTLLFKNYPNIKICLSGHEHTIDKVEHEGIIYLCSGSVCADWWNTGVSEKGYSAGYRLIDFYKNGEIREQYITY